MNHGTTELALGLNAQFTYIGEDHRDIPLPTAAAGEGAYKRNSNRGGLEGVADRFEVGLDATAEWCRMQKKQSPGMS